MSLTGRIILVTGASSGIGAATAAACAAEGATVIATARRAERLEELASRSGEGRIVPMPGDVSDRAAVASLFERIERDHGRLDVLVNNAGVMPLAPMTECRIGTKHAVHAISEGLRNELAESGRDGGHRIRVTIIAPGVVVTELPESITDESTRERVRSWYTTMEGPLTSEDVAEAILFAIRSPAHVAINEILLRPTAQVS